MCVSVVLTRVLSVHECCYLLEAVHLDEQLVKCHLHRLLLLWVSMRADGVDLVDEYDARRALLSGGEELAYALRAHAYKYLLKLGARHVKEGHTRLARDGARQQRLARAGRPREEAPLGQLAAEARECLG